MGTHNFLGIIVIIIVFAIWYLAFKLIFSSFIFKPYLKSKEISDILEKNSCSLIEIKSLTNDEKLLNHFNLISGITIDKLFSIHSEFKMITLSNTDKKHQIFWVEINSWFPPFGKRNLKIKQELDSVILNDLQESFSQYIIIIKDKCPACKSEISIDQSECGNCGLNLLM